MCVVKTLCKYFLPQLIGFRLEPTARGSEPKCIKLVVLHHDQKLNVMTICDVGQETFLHCSLS